MNSFFKGITNGIPIALGYLFVSFGFGITAVRSGLTVTQAVCISMTNLTSAGQAAGVEIIARGGTLAEMALTQLVINMRYALMAIALSCKLAENFSIGKRLTAAFGITDEIFAAAYAVPGKIKASYMYGLILIAFIGWSGGTFLGAAAGHILPEKLTNAMGIMLYGMFTAIVIPVSKRNKNILAAAVIAVGMSVLFRFVLTGVSPGFAVIISAVTAAAVMAAAAPSKEDEKE